VGREERRWWVGVCVVEGKGKLNLNVGPQTGSLRLTGVATRRKSSRIRHLEQGVRK